MPDTTPEPPDGGSWHETSSPKSQRIHIGDRARAHGEDVAHDAANAGCSALIGFDERWMVVAFHLEDRRQPFADIDDAGILSRSAYHPGRAGRQLFQMFAR